MRVLGGGLSRGGALIRVADVSVLAESGRLPGGGRVRAYAQVLGIASAPLSGDHVGDLQGISNIEAPDSWRLYQVWAEVESSSGQVAVLAGLLDLNGEFYVTEAASAFLNPSHGIGPELALTGRGGPSIYPNTALAVRLRWDPSPGVTVRTAAFDAVPGAAGDVDAAGVSLSGDEGALLITEAESRYGAFSDGGAGVRVAGGGWWYTAPEQRLLEGEGLRRNRGAYVMVEGALPGCSADGPCVRAFARGGFSDPHLNQVARAWGAGVLVEAGADGPMAGAALARAGSGSPYRALCLSEGGAPGSGELNLELTARIPLPVGITIQPDLQYILDPGMDQTRANTLVGGLRVAISM